MEFIGIREGFASFGPYRTWYRITGDLGDGRTPLVILHGGPGCTHDYVDAFKDIATSGYPVIHYDQLGNGRSTHLPEKDSSFWNVALFLDELENLLDHLGISDNYALLGQSWGGMLASEHAVLRPTGLRALIVANSPADMGVWIREAHRLRLLLPYDVQQTLLKHERAGTLKSAEYLEATRVFYDRHVCRVTPWPGEVSRTFAQIDADPTVYHAMNGPTEFHVIGSMKDWTIIDRLWQISVPTLLISGLYDEATPTVVKPYLDHIPDVRWALFENSSHMPHVEERMACMGTVVRFLDECL
ncbi:acetoin dehydrogenase dihydrolipoyllysine-residue acetyltransferase subunit [Pseudomonas sp. FW306-02-F02-AA]|uniref:Amino acid amidase n=1 Tax=Pseudomonas fluorescens TaxID=294 RepID=A0A0N9VXQ2_PSEFL|nr:MULTISPECIES: proline iminopeptidase-family hydrolase [Pseudomonas]PMZ08113.1 acetoin dehydrogenase dihydrolipoyllysine-residue acetyltransferase subunit [Pseudomonas sp. FW306-02-H06C]PMZ32579.1 acetoin dehydrogenase dihydrolipoyllysine-residue acetyltransferase subunit [Pseudomonas sp. FW306-02-H06B]ALI03589.1 amino acid amidase [Pseudomonas fluorescens]PMZ02102.1 acetoin dehydrogenase dihydrolipoyllysine-residue acetyltransferase subunit [Pseudomonas sp. FW306-02-F02-AB]PMZ14667.1 acetoi